MAVFLFIIILCDVLVDVGVLFFLRSDVHYILVSDTIMAVLLFIVILCDFPIDRVPSFLL